MPLKQIVNIHKSCIILTDHWRLSTLQAQNVVYFQGLVMLIQTKDPPEYRHYNKTKNTLFLNHLILQGKRMNKSNEWLDDETSPPISDIP